jgi:hypothetical protein
MRLKSSKPNQINTRFAWRFTLSLSIDRSLISNLLLPPQQKIESLIARIKQLYTSCAQKSQALLAARDSAKALMALIEQKRIARAARSLVPTDPSANAKTDPNSNPNAAVTAEEEAEDQRLMKQMEQQKNAAKSAAKEIKEMKCMCVRERQRYFEPVSDVC